jgi:hypothetical protein
MKYLIVVVLLVFSVVACKKQTETLDIANVASYYPLSIGNVFIYKMDSTRLVNFTSLGTVYYLVKDSVAGSFVDLTGRKSYTVFRYLTDTLASQPYQYSETHYVVYDKSRIEYVDGRNFRFIPLANPLSFNTSWHGNSYLDSAQLRISDNTTYYGWLYQYTSINQPYTVLDSTYQNTISVQQVADSSKGDFDIYKANSKTYSREVYAKGVGLVEKNMINYFFQPQIDTPVIKAGYYEDGYFAVNLSLLSYKK